MKKFSICLIIILIGILAIVNNSYATISQDKISIKTEKILEQALKEYLEPYKSDKVSEEKRIKDYMFSGYSVRETYNINDVATKYVVDFSVTPINDENTIWLKHKNVIFVDLNYKDGEFGIKKIFDKPDNLDEFYKKFEENKKNKVRNQEQNTEIKTIAAKSEGNNKAVQVEKISNYIYLVGGLVLTMNIIIGILLLKKSRINHLWLA